MLFYGPLERDIPVHRSRWSYQGWRTYVNADIYFFCSQACRQQHRPSPAQSIL